MRDIILWFLFMYAILYAGCTNVRLSQLQDDIHDLEREVRVAQDSCRR